MKQGEEIHITIPKEQYFHNSVNNKDGSTRCHKNLYNKLRRSLKEHRCWEPGDSEMGLGNS